MDIVNDTSDDAKVKVSGGPGQLPRGGGQPAPPKVVELRVGARSTLNLKSESLSSPLPALPWTVHLFVPVEVAQCKVSSQPAKLTLTKVAKNGYKIAPGK